MNTIAINFSDFIRVQNNQPLTTSEFIATAFKKRHDNVIQSIDNLLAEIPADFATANFREVDVMRDNPLTGGKTKSRAFELSKDGFMLLVMGFTGKAALAIKIAYIKAFNAMAQKLSAPALPNNTVENRKGLVAAVRQLAQKNGMSYPNAFHLVHQRFNVESVEQLSVAQELHRRLNISMHSCCILVYWAICWISQPNPWRQRLMMSWFWLWGVCCFMRKICVCL